MTDLKTIRLSKRMSELGICSRREADELIAQGLVIVNGERVSELGTKVAPDARVELVTEAKRILADQVTIVLNKPVGYVSSQPENNYSAAVELITGANQMVIDGRRFRLQDRRGLAPAGRLDIDSRGLLILTQDGALVKKIIGPESRMEKEYHVSVRGEVTEAKLRLLRHGLELDDKPLLPAKIEVYRDNRLIFILQEGRKRQIRRMCDLVDLKVHSLYRVRIGRLELGNLPEGKWRYLRPHESP